MGSEGLEITAIIVNYKTPRLLLQCLDAAWRELEAYSAEVIVVDNHSCDDSVALVRKQFPQTLVIENTENKGFGTANNQGFSKGRGRFFLLVNSDAFLQKGAVFPLLEALKKNSKAALSGPRLLNPDLSLQVSCYRFPSPLRSWLEALYIARLLPWTWEWGTYDRWDHAQATKVESVIGACLLLRREVIEDVGAFDEKFFLYVEETDWQLRMRKAGWEILFVPDAKVIHCAGASQSLTAATFNQEAVKSQHYYYLKHFGRRGLWTYKLAALVGNFLRALYWSLIVVGSALGRMVNPSGFETSRALNKFLFSYRLACQHLTHGWLYQNGKETPL